MIPYLYHPHGANLHERLSLETSLEMNLKLKCHYGGPVEFPRPFIKSFLIGCTSLGCCSQLVIRTPVCRYTLISSHHPTPQQERTDLPQGLMFTSGLGVHLAAG